MESPDRASAAEAAADLAASLGATASALADVSDIVFRTEFRSLCEANRCGSYDKGWMCPPAVGSIEDLVAGCRSREKVLVFNLVGELATRFDYKGMMAGAQAFARLVQRLNREAAGRLAGHAPLVLGAGPCRVCRRCAYLDREGCRHPESAVMSLEANGVDVSQLAKLTGLRYNYGPETVTYFGAVLFNP
jgi:predicted metal-binding protein